MSEPDLNLLIALDALITEASVAAAARRLGLSASAMSRTLSRLRTVTGDPLLVRAGRRMVLTPGAEALRERTRNIIHEARSVLRPSMSTPDISTLRRTFTIRANDGFVEAFGAVLIGAIGKDAPFVRLCFAPKAEKSSQHLREGSADLEIGVVSDMGPEVRLQTLFRDHFVGAVRPGHPLETIGDVTLAHYVACGHVIASRRGRSSGPVDQALAAIGLKRNIVAIVPSFPAALAIARTSDLVALVPASFLPAAQRASKVGSAEAFYRFELPVATEPITISQMWHPRLERDPVHRWLRERILEVCRAVAPLQRPKSY
ncbi:DNA-binding transcriptional LysR family regulator [Herbaspirillum sp. Sphag1AN]|uniref:LysR family transcriptional regulator n=1 Tax=unclassified Herbaspirillum TaxID=2624150 RepID=UPI00161360DD|nr:MULTISPECIES: LysR family transcriptional regulator [unclassified Herbaspirillum]MBB3212693.1 DNA-binding transcriptional LysR family regulator [Herbaspirillum sp. Sphag1AN]MBB3245890.1 DNA-binding transcriptional LysR family regulator [Herbaspirillum sp. Sphag64]